jgi:hypothetical protein
MSHEFASSKFPRKAQIEKNLLINGGFELWQRYNSGLLNASITNVATSLVLKATSGSSFPAGNFPASGYLLIDNEILFYAARTISTNTFSSITRPKGVADPATQNNAAHSANAVVHWVVASNGAYGPDRWYIGEATNEQLFVYRVDATMTEGTSIDASSKYAAAVRCVTGVGTNAQLRQDLEDYTQLRGRTVSFSARIKVNQASKVRLIIESSGATLAASGFHTGSNAYETLEIDRVTIPTNSTGVTVAIDFTTDVGYTAYIDNTFMNFGEASEYVPENPTDEFTRCQRFYEKVYAAWAGRGDGGSQDTGYFVPFAVEKSPIGTITATVFGTWTTENMAQPEAYIPPSSSLGVPITRKGVFVRADSTADNHNKFEPGSGDDYIVVEVL